MDIFLIVLAVVLLIFVLPAFLLSYIIFSVLLVRTKPDKWTHGISQPDEPEIATMYTTGAAWREEHIENMQIVGIENDGLKLYGEYYDFGYDRAVIILAGRMECCVYCCYFAEPYRKAGYNVLTIDGRAHGFSEGKYNTIGTRESRDLIRWGELLHNEKGNEHIVLHGICIGAASSLYAITAEDCPDYFEGITVEGMFKNFYESTKNHMIYQKRPLFPFLQGIMVWIRIILHARPIADGPYKRIKDLKKPILFIHSREDIYSLPAEAEQMYADCTADKRILWLDHGFHSRLRIVNTEEYDRAVTEFLAVLEPAEK